MDRVKHTPLAVVTERRWSLLRLIRALGVGRLLLALALGVAALMPLSAAAFSTGQWLYEVELPVSAQSVDERQRAAGLGLLQVLSRVTGLVSIPRNSEVNAAVANPERYYNEFVFYSEEDENRREQPHVRIVFQRDAILQLARAARLPIWWNRRPQIMLWVVKESDGRREILDSNSKDPLVKALRQHAASRGLPVMLPLMDLDDRLAVSAGDIWGRVTNTLDDAAERYDADLVLVGRVREQSDPEGDSIYQGDWEVWQRGQPLVTSAQQASAAEMAAAGLNALADRMAERFAVLPRGLQRQQFAVSGLQDIAGYAELLAYMGSLDFVDEVNVASLDAQSMSLLVDSHAEIRQLIMLLTAEGRFVVDEQYRGAGTGLIWQG